MVCSSNVFAASTYIDQETGTEITLPENWSEVPLLQERQYLDAKFMNKSRTVVITYSSYDIATEIFLEAETEEVRKYLNMSAMTIEDAKELLSGAGYSNIEKVTYNDVDYFKAELTPTLNGQEYDIEQLHFLHFNNGWCYYFLINKTEYYEYYDDFKSLIEGVKYPYSEKIDVDNSAMSSNAKTALSYYELFQKGPTVYVPILLIMLLITLMAYATFPLAFALMRKKIITKAKYNLFCYGINFGVMIFFILINGKSSGSPYFLWTCVFSIVGTNILKRRQVLEGYQPSPLLFQDEGEDLNTSSYNISDGDKADESNETAQVSVCKNCGASIPNNSMFCHKCGTKVYEED